jgi:putative SOS response-associated peptidase YedK
MCRRYSISITPEALEKRFHAVRCHALLTPTSNAAPSQTLPVILNTTPHEITVSAWGFVPEWADGRPDVTPLINACAETVATTHAFQQAFRTKRCLVLADGFYAWQRDGRVRVPYRIALKSGEPFAFAGTWSTVHDPSGHPYTTFTILTTEANFLVSQLQDRMPVMLRPWLETIWLNPHCAPDAQALLAPCPSDLLTCDEVSPKGKHP